MSKLNLSTLCLGFVVGLAPSIGVSGDLNLSQNALELGEGGEPNVVIIVDDSGSMDWEVITTDYDHNGLFTNTQRDGSNPAGAGSIRNRTDCTPTDGSRDGYIYGVRFDSNWDSSNECNTAHRNAWRFRNSDFNPLYFDPDIDYPPWVGLNEAGVAYTDISITNAPNDPYNPTEYRNLTNTDALGDANTAGFKYYTWSDDDDDGFFDDDEETQFKIKNQDAATQQNFANWFGYWRSRNLVTKGAVALAIADATNMRVGYTTINTSSHDYEVARMNPLVTTGNKNDLLRKIYSTDAKNGGTPLREALEDVGKYFECTSNNKFNGGGTPSSDDCPMEVAPKGTCQQNFAVLMTDGFYNGDDPSVGNADSGGSGDNNNTDYDGGRFADTSSNTLADVAMHYYENDLQSTLANSVNTTARDVLLSDLTLDDDLHQHMTTYTVGFGVEGALSGPPATGDSWPSTSDNAGKIDDLLHAAYNGRGEFYSALDPTALAASLQSAFEQIAAGTGASSAVAFNTQDLQSGARLFRAFYNTQTFSGDIEALSIDEFGAINTATPIWTAAALLDAKITADTRVLITYDPDANEGIPFEYASLTATQKSSLNSPLPGSLPGSYGNADAAISDERLDWLRGDSTNEGDEYDEGEFRDRPVSGGKLGDMINSTPVFVGAPPFSGRDFEPYPVGTGNLYSTYAAAKENRDPVVYIGANDGMLHGFSGDTGAEVVGYFPSGLIGELSELTKPAYVHQMYVDGSPTINDAFVRTTSGGSKAWSSILIGGLNGGGRGYYALDVTDPTDFADQTQAAAKVMWEFTADDDSDLGYTFSQPVIAMTNKVDGGEQQWAAIFGNGYNSSSSDGDSALFIVFIDGGVDGTWSATDYVKITTGYGKAESADGATPNGLSDVRAVDIDNNGTVDYIYAGDLQGHLYRFDLTRTNSNQWTMGNSELIFSATYGTASGSPVQPFTTRPVVVSNDEAGGINVIAATGSWITAEDSSSTDIQSIYAIRDDFSNNHSVSRSDLYEQQFINQGLRAFTDDDGVDHTFTVSTSTEHVVDWNDNEGWFVDFDMSAFGVGSGVEFPGERAIRKLAVRGGVLTGNTVLPRDINTCDGSEGGFRIALDPVNGKRPDKVVFDLNNDGRFDGGDNINGSSALANIVTRVKFDTAPSDTACIGSKCITQTSDKKLVVMEENTLSEERTGRLSWREIHLD